MSTLPPSEPGLSETEREMQAIAHKFASEVLRPAGIYMDRRGPEAAIAQESPLWAAYRQHRELGLNLVEATEGMSKLEAMRVTYLVNEELGWGDLGLGWSMYAATFPAALARAFGRQDLAEQFTYEQIGCWGITEPNHGSDMLDFTHTLCSAEAGSVKRNCVVTRRGDTLVIRGQKGAWCSNGSIAQTMSLFCHYDDGGGLPQRAAFLVPLDLPGVRRGRPLDKLGVRSLTDAEIFFDEVELPLAHLVCPPEAYDATVGGILLAANPGMAIFVVGCARAAYEYAVGYAKERIQGGRPIVEHQAVKLKLFEMFRKIEAARALARYAMVSNGIAAQPFFPLAVSAKVTGTQMGLEVTNAAFEILGGNATSKEYPIEKLLRDARMAATADGTNDVLSLMASSFL
jgi:acyl-CoA dehydrogenase